MRVAHPTRTNQAMAIAASIRSYNSAWGAANKVPAARAADLIGRLAWVPQTQATRSTLNEIAANCTSHASSSDSPNSRTAAEGLTEAKTLVYSISKLESPP